MTSKTYAFPVVLSDDDELFQRNFEAEYQISEVLALRLTSYGVALEQTNGECIRLTDNELEIIAARVHANRAHANLRRAQARVTESEARFARKVEAHRNRLRL